MCKSLSLLRSKFVTKGPISNSTQDIKRTECIKKDNKKKPKKLSFGKTILDNCFIKKERT